MHKIIDTKLLELQHYRAEVGPEDLRVRVVLHLLLVRLLRVQTETLPRLSPASSAGSLLGAGFTDSSHQERLDSDTGVVHLESTGYHGYKVNQLPWL